MTRIAPLRRQLTALRETRQWVRWGTGYAGLALAIAWTLWALFALDVVFQLSLVQRLLLLATAIAGTVWAYGRFTRRFLQIHEDDFDVALLVEKEHQIDSDLIAALQFESPEAVRWGSPQLETAVIDYVAELGGGLNIFQGLSREQLVRRATLLAVTLAATVTITAAFPRHVRAFLNRLFLGSNHYPTATHIHQLLINRVQVLHDSTDGTQPQRYKAPQGQSLRFELLCGGSLPETGTVRLASGGSRERRIDLLRLNLDQRLARLREADEILADTLDDAERLLREVWREEAVGALRLDAPAIADYLRKAPLGRDTVEEARDRLAKFIQQWPGQAAETSVYSGELSRLVDAIQYKIYLGDAWTDPADVDMIPLPIVELRLEVEPPDYARAAEPELPVASRQMALLEGSSVDFGIEVMNAKRLTDAWVIVRTQPEPKRLALTPRPGDPRHWQLIDSASPFKLITEELHFELQVRDEDGMTLERPLPGLLRLRSDRPPTGSQEVVHRVVLATAKPIIEYRASDDFGVAELKLLLQVEPHASSSSLHQASSNPNADSSVPDESSRPVLPVQAINLLSSPQVVSPDKLPLFGRHQLDLGPLKLVKGDRVRVTLEVRDFRGKADGLVHQSDPLFLEISDESGVYAAILEADQKSEKQLNEIIQRELGIGESP